MEENIFEKRDQESKEEYERLGLGNLDATLAMLIRSTAIGIISKNNITDEAEKLQVYQDVKRQRLEYQEQKEKEREAKYDITQTHRYKQGFEASIRFFSIQNEKEKNEYNTGWTDAAEYSRKQYLESDEGKEKKKEDDEKIYGWLKPNTNWETEYITGREYTERLKAEMEADPSLVKKMQELDERLAKLEKYTQE
jgi:hypothetical protein